MLKVAGDLRQPPAKFKNPVSRLQCPSTTIFTFHMTLWGFQWGPVQKPVNFKIPQFIHEWSIFWLVRNGKLHLLLQKLGEPIQNKSLNGTQNLSATRVISQVAVCNILADVITDTRGRIQNSIAFLQVYKQPAC